MINNEQRATGLQVAPQRYYDTTVIHHDDTTTRRYNDVLYSQGGWRGKGRTDKNFTKPLFSSATSFCKNGAQSRRSGMILLLVIALLVLLALMGTIFILMASTDRQSAYASNGSTSLNFAQQGVLNTVRGLMLNQTLDENNQTLAVGMYNSSAGVPHTGYPAGFIPDQYNTTTKTGGQIARFWDYPEVGAMGTGANYSPNHFYQSVIVQGSNAGTPPPPTQYAPSEPWLVNNQSYEPNYIPGTTSPQTLYVPGEEVFYASENTTSPFNMTGYGRYIYTGTANVAASPPPAGWASASGPTGGYALNSAVPTTVATMPLVSTLSPYLYDPSTGAYGFSWSVGGTASATNIVVPNAAVVEPRWIYNKAYNPLLPEAAGNMPVAPSGDLDAMWNLLPYSDPNGTRYRFAVRIMDMSSLLNLNTGWIPSADPNTAIDAAYGEYGTFISSCPILDSVVNTNTADIPSSEGGSAASTPYPVSNVQAGNTTTIPGRIGSYPNTTAFYNLPIWQNALDEYEIQYPNASPPTANTSLFGLNSEMDLLTAAGAGGMPFGAPYFSRLATLLPNTLGLPFVASNDYYGSGYRSLYTDYSWTRDIAAVTIPSVGSGVGAIPAVGPAKLNLNETLSAGNVASFANQLYETLISCGYNAIHAGSFVANYLTYRFGAAPTTTTTGAPVEPAYIATDGQLYDPALGIGTSTNPNPVTITAMASDTNSYVGTTAQPFLNELEVQITTTATGTNPYISGWGVELMNPFPGTTNLNLNGWELVVITPSTPAQGTPVVSNLGSSLTCPTPPGTAPIGPYVVTGNPFAVVTTSGSGMAIGGTNTPQYTGAPVVATNTDTSITILLERPVANGIYAVVDQISYTVPAGGTANYPEGATPITTWYADVSRDNINQPEWGCDSAATLVRPPQAADFANLGLPNIAAVSGNPGMPLYDRFYSGYSSISTPFLTSASIDSNDDLINIDDFNCIAREGNYTTSAPAYDPLSAQIAANVANANVTTALATQTTNYPGTTPPPNEALQADLYFDFTYDPRAAYTAADAGFADPVVTANGGVAGEIPPTILSMTTLTDRSQSNTAAASALPESTIDLVRQAGKININTAGPDVLYSVFSEDGALAGDTTPALLSKDISTLVDDTIAFRERLAAGKGSLPLFAVTPGTVTVTTVPNGLNNYSIYGGTGFQSSADMLLALLPTVESGTFPTGAISTPATLQQRDAAWADVENFITVRSDTFAVYGLIQALRLNPNWINTADYVPTDWYNANQGTFTSTGEYMITADPTSTADEFILEGSRRFIAIIDRSYCNNGAIVQPHIVALKLLPQ